ncbi:hypothetical protein GIW70_13375 [Pseudomonas syringae]|nr:hypothetical protein [Pseudomonas syringae]MCF5069175.1 hypothetical protein [Pseudomonas syringae]
MQSPDLITANSADELQKKFIATAITQFIDNPYARNDLGWAWNKILAPCVNGTGFSQLHRSANIYLSILVKHSVFTNIREKLKIPDDALFLVDEQSHLYFSYQNLIGDANGSGTLFVSPKDITASVAGLTDLNNDLRLLANMARLSGGWIVTGERIMIGQWLGFQRLTQPDNEEDSRSLIDLLNFAALPESPQYGNYWQLLDAPIDSPFCLDEEQRVVIQKITNTLTGGESSLVEHFGVHLILENTSADALATSLDYRLQKLIDTAVWSSESADAYLIALGWHDKTAQGKPARELVEQVLIAAMLLDLDLFIDSDNTTFAGFDLYSKRFFTRHPSWVREQLEEHLITALKLDQLLAPLVAELVLGGMAPQYRFADWPSELMMGTPAWVVGTQAVHFAEALIPGVTRKMSYSHLLGFAQSAKATPQLSSLHAIHSVDPVINWALMNEIITRDADNNLSEAAVSRAAEEYKRYLDQILGAAQAFGKALPHRKPLALEALKSTVPDCDPDELLVKHRGTGGAAGRKVSIVDLYMGDELHSQDWDRARGTSLYASFPALSQLLPINELYEPVVYKHFTQIIDALSDNIEIALSQLHPYMAAYIEHGALGIYSVQEYTTTRFETAPGRPGIIRPETPLPGETGRYGVIICAQVYNKLRCFELFPLRMECRYNPKLADVFRPLVSEDFGGQETTFTDKAKLEGVPLDVTAYLQNAGPRANINSKLFIRKIGEFKSNNEAVDPAYPAPFFRSRRKEELARLIGEENPYFTESELYQLGMDQTERERAIEKNDAIFNTILNLNIPFKECVEGLASGDSKRQQGAIVDCIVDAAVLALTIAAIPGKIAAVSTKAAALATKVLSASRVLAGTALSLFNPLDGLPKLLKGGGKLIGRGVSKLSGHALSASRQARQQLRYLTGSNSYDLLKALDHTGSASQIRMSLDPVAHARALFKSDSITTVEQVLARLSEKNFALPKGASDIELRQLTNSAIKQAALNSTKLQDLEKVIGRPALDEILDSFIQGHPIHLGDPVYTPSYYAEMLESIGYIELKKSNYMKTYQQNVLKKDLGAAPFSDVMPESAFNPQGYTDPTQRAAAWMVNGSSDATAKDFDNIVALLSEYASNSASLTDPAVIREIRRRLVPSDIVDRIRDAGGEGKHGSSITGFALLEQHLKILDINHPHFDKHILAAIVGFQGFGDGNGRTASALYSISQLRGNRFTPMPKHVFRELNGIF